MEGSPQGKDGEGQRQDHFLAQPNVERLANLITELEHFKEVLSPKSASRQGRAGGTGGSSRSRSRASSSSRTPRRAGSSGRPLSALSHAHGTEVHLSERMEELALPRHPPAHKVGGTHGSFARTPSREGDLFHRSSSAPGHKQKASRPHAGFTRVASHHSGLRKPPSAPQHSAPKRAPSAPSSDLAGDGNDGDGPQSREERLLKLGNRWQPHGAVGGVTPAPVSRTASSTNNGGDGGDGGDGKELISMIQADLERVEASYLVRGDAKLAMLKDRVKTYSALDGVVMAAKEAWGEDAGWQVRHSAAAEAACDGGRELQQGSGTDDPTGRDVGNLQRECDRLASRLAREMQDKEAAMGRARQLEEEAHNLSISLSHKDKELSQAKLQAMQSEAKAGEEKRAREEAERVEKNARERLDQAEAETRRLSSMMREKEAVVSELESRIQLYGEASHRQETLMSEVESAEAIGRAERQRLEAENQSMARRLAEALEQARERGRASGESEAKLVVMKEAVEAANSKVQECIKMQRQWSIDKARLEHTIRRLETQVEDAEQERDSVLSSFGRRTVGSRRSSATASKRSARDSWVTQEMQQQQQQQQQQPLGVGRKGEANPFPDNRDGNQDAAPSFFENDEFQQELRRTIQDLSSGLHELRSLADAP